MDFTSFMDLFSNSGVDGMAGSSDVAAGGEGGGSWSYWAKAIQDAVIGQSAGFDAVNQNKESEPLAVQATGDVPVSSATRGTYSYNLEGNVPILSSFSNLAYGGRLNGDPLYKKDVDKVIKNAQNNASGSNATLDTSLNKDARKVAGVSEGGSTPQMFATSMPKNESFNSMMDSYENLGLPLDSPKYRKGGTDLMSMFSKLDMNSTENMPDLSSTVESTSADNYGDSTVDWMSILGSMWGG